MSAGGTGAAPQNHSVEIFSPPYLFKGARPSIVLAPPSTDYLTSGTGTIFSLSVEEGNPGDAIAKVTLLRPGSVTHAVDFNQRYVELRIESISVTFPPLPTPPTYNLNVVKPEDGNVCPPGWYMLFTVSQQGIPSVGRWLHIE